MRPVGTATTAIPIITMKLVKIFPPGVIGNASPYPTVVNVTMAHQKESYTEPKTSG